MRLAPIRRRANGSPGRVLHPVAAAPQRLQFTWTGRAAGACWPAVEDRVPRLRNGGMASVKRICVYCGSSGRVDEAYRASATRLGVILAKAGIELVYGGGRI